MPSSDRELTPARLGAVLFGATACLLAAAAAVYGISIAWHDGPHLGPPDVIGSPTTLTTDGLAPPPTSTTSTTATPPPTAPTTPADPASYAVTVDDCRQNGADLRIYGAITNRGSVTVTYRITASATTPSGTVLASGVTETGPVAAGERVGWEVRTTSEVQLPDVGARCDVTGVAAR